MLLEGCAQVTLCLAMAGSKSSKSMYLDELVRRQGGVTSWRTGVAMTQCNRGLIRFTTKRLCFLQAARFEGGSPDGLFNNKEEVCEKDKDSHYRGCGPAAGRNLNSGAGRWALRAVLLPRLHLLELA